jgi:hypothetical protein
MNMELACGKCGKLFYAERATRKFCSKRCSGPVNAKAGAAVTNHGPNAKINKVRKRAVFAKDYRSDYEPRA